MGFFALIWQKKTRGRRTSIRASEAIRIINIFLFSCSIKVFYGSGDCLVLDIPTSDSDDIPEIVRRLEEISIGCQVKQGFLTGFFFCVDALCMYLRD